MKTFRQFLTPAAFALLVVLSTVKIQAQTVINSLPYTINIPGDYVLGGNLIYSADSGFAITFNVGNVTLDFAGHFISNLGAGKGTTAYGLYGNNRANITIQNGSIVGFSYAIFLSGDAGNSGNNTGNIVQNMRLPSNTTYGIGLFNPTTCRVENCQVNKTGGSTASSGQAGIGIFVSGGSVLIRNNQISTITGTDGSTDSYGILAYGSSRHFVVGNQIDTCMVGVATQGKYKNNLTANCTTPFVSGTDAGGNNQVYGQTTTPIVWDGIDAGGNN